MTYRTSSTYFCANGHSGRSETVENDQPHSKHYERVDVTGMVDAGKDPRDYTHYVCDVCEAPMLLEAQ